MSKPIHIEDIKREHQEVEKPFKHAGMFGSKYPSVFLVAKKNSGKTVLLYNILKNAIDKNTELIIFCSTHTLDKNYKTIINYFRKKGVKIRAFHSIYTEVEYKPDKYRKINMLRQIMKEIKQESEPEEPNVPEDEEAAEEKASNDYMTELMFGVRPKPPTPPNRSKLGPKPKKEKSKFQTPSYCFVFDDISTELKDLSMPAFLKVHRHYQAMSIISSQYPLDLESSGRKQIDDWILFKGHSKDKLESIHKDSDVEIEFDEFNNIYHHAVKPNYSWLHVDTRKNKLTQRFDGQEY